MTQLRTVAELQALIQRRNQANIEAQSRCSGDVFLPSVLELLDDVSTGRPLSSGSNHTLNFCGAAEIVLVRGFRVSLMPAGEAILAEARQNNAIQRKAA